MTIQIKSLNSVILMMIAALTITLTSCSEEGNGLVDVGNFTNTIENQDGERRGGSCIDLVYPVTWNIGGEEVTVDSREDFWEVISAYKEEAGDDAERPTLVYPVTIVNQAGEETQIASEEEFASIKEMCEGRTGKGGKKGGHCFDLVFPVTMNIGGEQVTFDDKESLYEALQAYKEEAGDDAEHPEFVFPLTVVDSDGVETTVASQEEYMELKQSCQGSRGDRGDRGGEKCFETVFPLTMNIGGEEVTFDDRESLYQALRAYKEEAGDNAERPTVVFPITIEYADGTQVEVENEEALDALKEDCGN